MALDGLHAVGTEASGGGSHQSSRANNPYRKISDKQVLQERLAEVERHLEEVVVDQRNQEVAVNAAQIMKDQDKSFAVVQFGAGHATGLVEELNKQGITVITVTPQEVADRGLYDE
jgi:pheromone shutdown protein TraB